MSSLSEKWTLDIQKLSDSIQTEFGTLPTNLLTSKISEKEWSIAEIFSHVISVNESYYPIFDQIQKGKYVYSMLGNFAFIRKYFGNIILKSVLPTNPKKQKTLPLWQPKTNIDAQTIIRDVQTHLSDLSSRIQNLEPLIKRNVTVASPANERIVYDLPIALDIIVAHMKRHLEQARRTMQAILPKA